jgi:LysR family cys regulon transcriptional activator
LKLQQFRYLKEVAKRGLNVSEAAEALHTSQPGISKQIRQLEEELGVDLLVRHGKRVVELTEPGRAILAIVERILQDTENLTHVAREFGSGDSGSLVIATTHTQARYALPPVVSRFTHRYPKVRLSLRQGSPAYIAELVRSGEADIAITTEAAELYQGLVLLPCHQWNRCVITPLGHPLLRVKPLTLEAIARYPVITYDFALAGESPIKRAFEQKQIEPNVVLTAIDADVIKVYVEMGLGVGILAKMAFDPARDLGLRLIDASHLFEPSMARIGLRPNAYLRRYAYELIEMFSPHLKRAIVDATLKGEGSSYEL